MKQPMVTSTRNSSFDTEDLDDEKDDLENELLERVSLLSETDK